MASASERIEGTYPRDPAIAKILLESVLRWYPLWHLPKGKDTVLRRLDPDNWSTSPGSITLGELVKGLMDGYVIHAMASTAPDVVCGDCDQPNGIELMKAAKAELDKEACHTILVKSGRPGHAWLWVISLGMPMEGIKAILRKYEADVRSEPHQMMRLPGTYNRTGNLSIVEGDIITHLEVLATRIPELENVKPQGDTSRSGQVQANALALVRHQVGLDVGFREAMNEDTPGSGHLLEKRPEVARACFIRAMVKALMFAKSIKSRTPGSRTPSEQMIRWAACANTIVRGNVHPRKAHILEGVIQGILNLAHTCGKTTLALSCRDVGTEANTTHRTAAKALRELRSLGILTLVKSHRPGKREASVYEMTLQNDVYVTHSGGKGVCPSDCSSNTSFSNDPAMVEYFTHRPAEFRVYRAILGGDQSGKAIASSLRMNTRAVRDHLKRLEQRGLIQRDGHTVTALCVDFAELAERRGVRGRLQQRRKEVAKEREAYLRYLQHQKAVSSNDLPELICRPRKPSRPFGLACVLFPSELDTADPEPRVRHGSKEPVRGRLAASVA